MLILVRSSLGVQLTAPGAAQKMGAQTREAGDEWRGPPTQVENKSVSLATYGMASLSMVRVEGGIDTSNDQ